METTPTSSRTGCEFDSRLRVRHIKHISGMLTWPMNVRMALNACFFKTFDASYGVENCC